MIRKTLRGAAYAVAPDFVVGKYLHYRMLGQARRLGEMRDFGGPQEALIESLWTSHFFRPLQKRSEILRLLTLVRTLQPATICEIGAAGGGTTFLLAQAAHKQATIIALDVAFNGSRQAALESLVVPGQKLFCLREDSHRLETVRMVHDRLEGRSLDVLFLDGDHSYEGVKLDFKLYSPMVAAGGLIVFHDIVSDHRARYGIETASDAGGVPQFWQELKLSYTPVEEFVEDYEQDGFGIGVIHWSGGGGS